METSEESIPPPESNHGRRAKRVLPIVLLSLALAALVAAGLYFLWPADELPTEETTVAEVEEKALEEKVAQPPPDEKPELVPDIPEVPPPPPEEKKPVEKPVDPRAEAIASLRKRIEAAGTDCSALKQLSTDKRLLEGSDSESAALREQVMGALAKHCRERLITEAKNLCPGVRPQELAPELVIVFDASGSMNFSLSATEKELQEAAAAEMMANAFRAFGAQIPSTIPEKLTREPRRITAAKQASLAIAKRIPADANVGLVLIEDCPSARRIGFFPPGRHGSLLSQLQAIQPKGGTPLADGIAQGGQMVDGVKREDVMLVVSDGQESCGRQDPCAIAQGLARTKPHLKINVVDITGTGAGNCIARATSGKVYTAHKAEEIALVTRQAAADALAPAHCARK
jgi:Mg-chelatase subunit ChlD